MCHKILDNILLSTRYTVCPQKGGMSRGLGNVPQMTYCMPPKRGVSAWAGECVTRYKTTRHTVHPLKGGMSVGGWRMCHKEDNILYAPKMGGLSVGGLGNVNLTVYSRGRCSNSVFLSSSAYTAWLLRFFCCLRVRASFWVFSCGQTNTQTWSNNCELPMHYSMRDQTRVATHGSFQNSLTFPWLKVSFSLTMVAE